jgi:hypothetical protein
MLLVASMLAIPSITVTGSTLTFPILLVYVLFFRFNLNLGLHL